MSAPRTVSVVTVDQGEVTIPEPAWCVGHHWQPRPYLADVTHNSVRVKAGAMTGEHGWVSILVARISHAPYALVLPQPYPVVSVEVDMVAELAVEDVPKVSQGLRVAAMRLENVAAEALRLRGGLA